MAKVINLYEAKTRFSELVNRAAQGEEIVIAKAGRPMVRLLPIASPKHRRSHAFGRNTMGIQFISPDFYKDITPEELLGELDMK